MGERPRHERRGRRPRAIAGQGWGGGGRRGVGYFWICGWSLQLAGPHCHNGDDFCCSGCTRSFLSLRSFAGDKALSHPGLYLTEALLTR